jgi:hemerythrin
MPDWGPLMEVGVPEIDEQHRELVRRINELGLAMKRGKGGETVADLLAFLNSYVELHFSMEEGLMREFHYPDIGEHRGNHSAFRKQFEEKREAYVADPGERSTTLDIHGWMMSWLMNHIMYVDMKLGEFLASRRPA